jgi:hypothetical protein
MTKAKFTGCLILSHLSVIEALREHSCLHGKFPFTWSVVFSNGIPARKRTTLFVAHRDQQHPKVIFFAMQTFPILTRLSLAMGTSWQLK